MMGVDSVDSNSRQKATKNNIDNGVAGRSILAGGRGGAVRLSSSGLAGRVLRLVQSTLLSGARPGSAGAEHRGRLR